MFSRIFGLTSSEWKRLRDQSVIVAASIFALSAIFGLIDEEEWVGFLASLLGTMSLMFSGFLYIGRAPRPWLITACSVATGALVGATAALFFSNGLYY